MGRSQWISHGRESQDGDVMASYKAPGPNGFHVGFYQN